MSTLLAKKQPKEREITLGDEDLTTPQNLEPQNYKEMLKDINVFNKSSTMNTIKSDLIMRKKLSKFEAKMAPVLATIQKIDNEDYLNQLFVFVLQSAEDYLYLPNKEKCNAIKKEICMQLLKPFVKDEVVRNQIIKICLKNIKKSTLFRRNRKLLQNFFLGLVKMLQRLI